MTIKEMLQNGKTPDELIKEISAAQREITREKEEAQRKAEQEKKRSEAVAGARQKVVEAMKEYSKLLYGVEPDIKLMDSFNKDLAAIEGASKLVTVDDDEKLRRFLRGILM